MYQVKIFSAGLYTTGELEETINAWLEEKGNTISIISVTQSISTSPHYSSLTITIIYQTK
jgi:hypothetical protein